MDTAALKKFAQSARRSLIEQVANQMNVVLAKDSLARRESPNAIARLEAAIQAHTMDTVVEQIAYIWFNRFSALRFMDVNHYTTIGIVSPAAGQSQPEILAEAKMGHIDPELVPTMIRQRVLDLISNKTPSVNSQAEAYRLLLVAACNAWHQAMPFLFEKIDDYTELLLPEDLLSEQSVLTQLRTVMTEESCQDVEIIGWLYQFYISEKKDEVFDSLKKNKKITPENIPAATQLFTPHWIVRYLVENSLGRLWMLNHPHSSLKNQMDYYIQPEEPETDFLQINSPEEIRICDPACGSGHMLVYAFDLLYAIYEEEGYDAADIPAKILTQNLYGIEIDERAGELAALALTMKARSKQRNYFRQQVRANICVLENVTFEPGELKDYMNFVGRDLFTLQLQNTLHQFEEADNVGSLIRPELTDVEPMVKFLNSKNVGSDLFLNKTHLKVMKVLEQAEYLSSKYHVVVANPPYMGGSGMNGRLSSWIKDNYSDYKSDLFSVFVIRCVEMASRHGNIGIMSPNVWMYIASYKKMRQQLIENYYLSSLIELPLSGFKSATVQISAYTLTKSIGNEKISRFIRLVECSGNEQSLAENTKHAIHESNNNLSFQAKSNSFLKIPGYPIAYWLSIRMREIFEKGIPLGKISEPRAGLQTGENEKFVRIWTEVAFHKLYNSELDYKLNYKWFPYNKGGDYRKWFGNATFVVNWESDGKDIKNDKLDKLSRGLCLPSNSKPKNQQYYFKECGSWTYICSSRLSVRYYPKTFLFDIAGCSIFAEDIKKLSIIISFLNSPVAMEMLKLIAPTLNFQPGDIASVPTIPEFDCISNLNTDELIEIERSDWNSKEISWDFQTLPLLSLSNNIGKIENDYYSLKSVWNAQIQSTKQLEEENNRLIINRFGLQDELTPEVPLSEITLTCNPYYRYGGNKTEAELESLLLADTMREFISYAVGCMFGRYSLDKPGVILANQGETLVDYLAQIPKPAFMPDEDNVIPILDGEWFKDDIVDRFRQFLRITFYEEHFGENLKFIEDAIGKNIRDFFLKDFYTDHLKRYKKRPIYWLFSSPKGTFNALIYMHRYREDTVSIVLNKYLREFKVKLAARIEHLNRLETSASTNKADKTRAIKEREVLKKNIDELDTWERDVIFPLALEQKSIDLDDGVKANYPKFGAALKKIPGLGAAED